MARRAGGGAIRRAAAALLLATAMLAQVATGARAGPLQSIPPPSGKGPPLLVISGQSGAGNYVAMATAFAQRGYAVVLADGNDLFGPANAGEAPFRAALKAAQTAPGALPGPVGVVGFSLGGASALTYGTRMGPEVGSVVAFYPYTAWIEDPAAFVGRIGVPTLVLTGVQDSYKACCLIGKARDLAKAAQAQKRPLRLVEYPQANHGFVLEGPTFRGADAADAVRRAVTHLGGAGKAKP